MKLTLNYSRILHKNIALMLCFGVLLLILRFLLTGNLSFFFLVWNLFLAALPYFISQTIVRLPEARLPISGKLFLFLLWLLFLPNSPYIITDLIHLHNDGSQQIWFDMFLVFVFALNGLLLGLLSLLNIYFFLAEKLSLRTSKYIIFLICLLSGYGIYLGRFLRFNSWDILTKPLQLFSQMAYSVYEPKAWFMTLAFGTFLWILFLLLKSVRYP